MKLVMKISILTLLILTAMVAVGLVTHRAHIRSNWYCPTIIGSEFSLRKAELLVPVYEAGITADSPEELERLARERYVQRLSERAEPEANGQ
jgi:hypothetical protein